MIKKKASIVDNLKFQTFRQQLKKAERLFPLSNYFGHSILLYPNFTGNMLLEKFSTSEFTELRQHLITTKYLRRSFEDLFEYNIYYCPDIASTLNPFDHMCAKYLKKSHRAKRK
ncbi:hypothetical protein K7432_018349 [Basidiobolus ranarum]|uniref:Uncharacterized protein n=1 Tax=Basidiobolus ranarum TaxID=34480 RepID=A0ABR2VK76_9FUNG